MESNPAAPEPEGPAEAAHPKPSTREPRVPAGAWGVGRHFSPSDLALFAELLAGLVRAQVPLPEALRMLGRDAEQPALRALLAETERDVSAGVGLADALRRRGGRVPELFVCVVEQGLAVNDLHAALVELVRAYRAQARFREALWAQLLAPIATLTCLGTLLCFSLLWNLPGVYVSVFKTFRMELPLPTRLFLWASEALQSEEAIFLGGCLLLLAAFAAAGLICSRRVRRCFHSLVLSLPLLSPFLKDAFLARFCRLVSILLKRGIPLGRALDLVKDSFGLLPMREDVARLAREVEQGVGFAEALAKATYFPATFVQFARAAQAHGELPESLARLAELYEERSEMEGVRVRFWIYLAAQLLVGFLVFWVVLAALYPFFRFSGAYYRW